ncbi:MAG: ATP-dependent DNA helicase RecG, partial [Fidelibacterota bacterium]
VSFYRGYQMVHPDFDIKSEDGESDPINTGMILPLYPSSEILKRGGLDSRGIRKIVRSALDRAMPYIKDHFSKEFLLQVNIAPFDVAIKNIHFPENRNSLKNSIYRMKFDEHFFLQLMLALRKRRRTQELSPFVFENLGPIFNRLYEKLPFELTGAQKRVIKEIRRDLRSSRPMNRLIQGDVGSGKTIVAFLIASIVFGNGCQVALMAPTEILAEQHYYNAKDYFNGLDVNIKLLIGAQKPGEREEILSGIMDGYVHFVIGTHAIIQDPVIFKDLGLVIIDEQHRFGVMQRATLREKSFNPHVLVMTATPIPRTLALTLYGDMDISLIDEMPEQRKQIKTRLVRERDRPEIYEFIREQIHKGRQVYVVYPLIEESEKLDFQAATDGYERLKNSVFPQFRVGLLHGRMRSYEKDSIMSDFKAGNIDVLVCTTVIEVGIDVPNATIMLIENSERFGLTQLHQLRGRVGRGVKQSYCIMMTGTRSRLARKRLKVIERTNNGFEIADEDLKLRGPGEFFGTRQHGLPELKIADIISDWHILRKAREWAFRVVGEDPHLRKGLNSVLRDYFIRRYGERYMLPDKG